MLAFLTLKYMLPLVLNLPCSCKTEKAKMSRVRVGGWLEVNERTVRVVTLLAFIFLQRLLQLKWSMQLHDSKLMVHGMLRKWYSLFVYHYTSPAASLICL
ncbi:hypothetical protein ACFX13_007717 [Malus domestica]